MNLLESVGGLHIASNPNLNSLGLWSMTGTVHGRANFENNANLATITSLSGITGINSYLRIYNCDKLNSTRGLHNVVSIGSYLRLYSNYILKEADFTSLSSISSYIQIDFNAALNLIDFPSLKGELGTSSYIYIRGNNNLESLSGFNGIERMQSYMYLRDLLGLTDMGFASLHSIVSSVYLRNIPVANPLGFARLQTVGSYLYLYGPISSSISFPKLKSIGGYLQLRLELVAADHTLDDTAFPVLETISGNLNILNANRLKKVTGFNSLEHVMGIVNIYNNPVLEVISGFSKLSIVGIEVTMTNNAALKQLDILRSVATIISGGVLIEGNAELREMDVGPSDIPLTVAGSCQVLGSPLLCCSAYFSLVGRLETGASNELVWDPTCNAGALDCAGSCMGFVYDVCGHCGGDDRGCCSDTGLASDDGNGGFTCLCDSGFTGPTCALYYGASAGMRVAKGQELTLDGAIHVSSGSVRVGTRAVRPLCSGDNRGLLWTSFNDVMGDVVAVCLWTGEMFEWREL